LFKTLGCKILIGHLPQTWACTYPETMGLWAGRTVEKQRTPGTQATCSLGFDLTIVQFLHHQAAQRIWNMTVLVSIQIPNGNHNTNPAEKKPNTGFCFSVFQL
jgi:hypothetical protein